jgi:DNA-binding CsgD family transcriptional regulator
MLLNGAATGIVKPSDRELLWDSVLRSLAGGPREPPPVSLADGRPIEIRCEPILDGTRMVGVLVRPGTAAHENANASPDGWSSLTDTERAVAEQVAQGLTNREAAAHLYLSPHTIDYHLRQLFRKLNVRSRVDLTRIIAQRPSPPPPAPTPAPAPAAAPAPAPAAAPAQGPPDISAFAP